MKTKIPILNKQTLDLIPIVDYTPNGAFVTKTGGYMDFVQIMCKDLYSAKEYDVEFDIISFANLFKTFKGDLKIVTMNFPVDTHNQINNINDITARTQNPVYLKDLDIEKTVLNKAHEELFEREFYLFFYANDLKEYSQYNEQLESYLGRHKTVKQLDFSKKVQILHKISNMNSDLTTLKSYDYIPQKPKKLNYNPYLLYQIQPQSNISFKDERITKKGDGYEACVHIYDYVDNVSFNWLSDVTLFENSISTIDIANTDRYQTIKNINKSMEEQTSRYVDARYTTDRIDAQKVYDQLTNVYDSMTSLGEVMKSVTIRIFVFNKTQTGLMEDIGTVISQVQSLGFKAGVFLDENAMEYKSLYLSATEQMKSLQNKRKGKSMSSEALATGHPYHFSSLDDPLGFYMGYTKTHGAVKLDRFHKDKQRLSYCGAIVGNMGSGKSTTLKRCIKLDIISGNYVRGFATNNEFDKLINYYGGKIINLDGSDGFLNALQVYKTHETQTSSFIKHISKLSTFYKFLAPNADEYDVAEFEILARKLYELHMGYTENSLENITGRKSSDYPIWSDLLQIIRSDIYIDYSNKVKRDDISIEHFNRVEKIELIINNLIKNYGQVFNGHSSIEDFTNEQIVFFNVANLKQYGNNIFDAQMFSSLSLLWDGLIAVGSPVKEKFDNGQITISEASKYMIYMDEAHNFINARKIHAVTFLGEYVREGRKFFGGILFATQRITDLFPDNSSADGISAIRDLLSLAQYKFIFKQGSESYEALQTAFRGELTQNDLDEIPTFEQGECVLVISGLNTLRFMVEVSKHELSLFAGGA